MYLPQATSCVDARIKRSKIFDAIGNCTLPSLGAKINLCIAELPTVHVAYQGSVSHVVGRLMLDKLLVTKEAVRGKICTRPKAAKGVSGENTS